MNIAIIRNADIYAPAPRGRGNILIINDKIAAMGPQVELPPWAADAAEPVEVDADGRTASPAMWTTCWPRPVRWRRKGFPPSS